MKGAYQIVTGIGILGMTLCTLAQEPQDVPRVYTAEQADAGQQEVLNNTFGQCSSCHANGLAGRNGDPDELPPLISLPEVTQTQIRTGGKVPQLAGPKFMQRWGTRPTKAFSAEMTRRFTGPLSEETQLNIMAYILQLNGALPGTQPLTPSTDVPINRLLKR